MERLCGTMVQEVFELTGYDRVMMAYKFHDDDDDHGEVVYEITKPGLESHIWVCIYEEARGSGGNSFLRTPICGSISAIKVISMAGEKKRAYNRNVKELSLIQSVSTDNSSVNELSSCHCAAGFASVDFIIWNLITETKGCANSMRWMESSSFLLSWMKSFIFIGSGCLMVKGRYSPGICICNSMGVRCIPYALSHKDFNLGYMGSTTSSLHLVGLQLGVKIEL
ncbi:unnamed protein product [Prunus armeniaca]|nr:unnamed protein product [Prunus armeniaca]